MKTTQCKIKKSENLTILLKIKERIKYKVLNMFMLEKNAL